MYNAERYASGDKNVRQVKEAKIFEQLAKKFPSVDERHLSALAEVWSIERDQIIKRMLDICRDEIGPVMPIDARPEAIFELAKLTLWLEDQIIEKRRRTSLSRVLIQTRSVRRWRRQRFRSESRIQQGYAQTRYGNASSTSGLDASLSFLALKNDVGHKRAAVCFSNENCRASKISTTARPSVMNIGL